MKSDSIIKHLKAHANAANLAGMARFGIVTDKALGISIPFLRKYAKEFKGDHELALELWESRIHEAQLMATMIDDPKKVTRKQMEKWVHNFNSWDICDQTCGNLFDKTPYAWDVALEWCVAEQEFVKRAGFVMMAALAVHDKKANDEKFVPFFKHIIDGSTDERNFVKKAVNWALRQIGKRNRGLLPLAIITAEQIRNIPSKSAKWIAADALRELQGKGIISPRSTIKI